MFSTFCGDLTVSWTEMILMFKKLFVILSYRKKVDRVGRFIESVCYGWC